LRKGEYQFDSQQQLCPMDQRTAIYARGAEFVCEFTSATLRDDVTNDAFLCPIPRLGIPTEGREAQVNIEASEER
jgi:hypothetical protein